MKNDLRQPFPRIARRDAIVWCTASALFGSMRRSALAGDTQVSREAFAQNELKRAGQRSETCSGSNAAGVGLRGEYFARESLAGSPLLVRIDSVIDFDATLDWPAQRKAHMPRSVRWTGWIKPPLSGIYRFHADAGGRLAVAGQLMGGTGANGDARIELAAGRFYPIRLEVARLTGGAQRLRFEWTAPHGARYVVPRALLFLPSESVPASLPRS